MRKCDAHLKIPPLCNILLRAQHDQITPGAIQWVQSDVLRSNADLEFHFLVISVSIFFDA